MTPVGGFGQLHAERERRHLHRVRAVLELCVKSAAAAASEAQERLESFWMDQQTTAHTDKHTVTGLIHGHEFLAHVIHFISRPLQ